MNSVEGGSVENSARSGVQALNRALDILEALALRPNGMRLAELSAHVGLHKSTVYRLVHTLAARNYVQVTESGCRLGFQVAELASRLLNSLELKTEAAPILRSLCQRTGFVVHLATLDDGEVVYLDKIESVQSIRMYSEIGRRAPFHCTALGKVLVAWKREEDVLRLIERYGLPAKTRNTITDPQRFQQEIRWVREMGYAIDDCEHEEGIRCVGAPIRDYRNDVIAAVSVTGPMGQLTLEVAHEVATHVVAAALEISKRMGFAVDLREEEVPSKGV